MPYTAPFPYFGPPYEPQNNSMYGVTPHASFYDQQRIFQSVAPEIWQPVQELNADQTNLNSEASQLTAIATALQTLNGAAQALQDTPGVLGTTLVSSNPSEVTALAGTGASSGSHTVNVTALATAQQNDSQGFASASSSPLSAGNSSGSLILQVGSGATTSFNIDTTTTLTSLAQQINAANLPLTAAVISTTSGSGSSQTTNYNLSITGTQTGAANTITFGETNLALNMAQDQTQAAADATGTIDGTSFDSPTNVVSDAVPGVTLNLLATTPSPVTLNVTYAPASLTGDITSLVNAYNGVVSAVGQSANGSVLLQRLLGQLAGDVGEVSPTAQGTVHSLIDLGISTGANGQLSIDTGALAQAIAADPHAVATVFANGPWSAQQGIADQLVSLTSDWGDPVAGTLSQMAAQVSQQANKLNQGIADAQYTAGTQMDTLHQQLTDLGVAQADLHAQNLEVQQLLPPSAGMGAAQPGQNGYGQGSTFPGQFEPYTVAPAQPPFEPWNNNGMQPPMGPPMQPPQQNPAGTMGAGSAFAFVP